jgi:hypothetical protein
MMENTMSRCLALAAVVVACGAPQLATAQSRVQAGVSAAVKGEVQIASLGASVGRVAKSGDDIYLGDQISSGKNAGMQVLLLDETVFTIGAQSAITIDAFVFDPATGGGKVAAHVVRGAFRFVTGRIANRRPRDMAVKLPIGSIGVRGTIAAGRVDGDSSLVVLLGPGSNTDTDERIGRILVSNAGKTVEISRVGFATVIEGLNAAPAEPFQLPLADLKALTRSLDQGAAPRDSGGQTTSKPASGGSTDQVNAPKTQALAGESQVTADQNADNTLNTGDATKDGDKLLSDAAQGELVNQLPVVSAGVTDFDELRRIQTGTHSFTIDTAFVQTSIDGIDTNLPGNMKVRLDFDFGARTLGGGASEVVLDTTSGGGNISLTASIPLNDYLKDTGPVAKTFGDTEVDPVQINGSRVELLNSNGIIAQTLKADIKFDDGFGNQGTGAGESAARVD